MGWFKELVGPGPIAAEAARAARREMHTVRRCVICAAYVSVPDDDRHQTWHKELVESIRDLGLGPI